jgi:citrate lyase subunit beta/citryl-CoA lyase
MAPRCVVRAARGGIEAALASAGDAILFPLNDASQPVEALRSAAREVLAAARAAGKAAFVTVNHPRTRLLRADLEAIVLPELSGVFLPHATEPQDVRDLAVLLRELELQRGIEPGDVRVFAVIDTARGLLRAAETAHAVPRMAGLVFDSAAYARDTGARDEERGPRLSYARGQLVAAARAWDILPLIDGAAFDLRQAAHHGFSGAVVEDLQLVAAAIAAFTPPEAARERARRHAAAYEGARTESEWVARTGTEIADAHSARKARQLLD